VVSHAVSLWGLFPPTNLCQIGHLIALMRLKLCLNRLPRQQAMLRPRGKRARIIHGLQAFSILLALSKIAQSELGRAELLLGAV